MTLKAGDVLFIPARTVHAVKNVGSGPGRPTYIVEKGKPLSWRPVSDGAGGIDHDRRRFLGTAAMMIAGGSLAPEALRQRTT